MQIPNRLSPKTSNTWERLKYFSAKLVLLVFSKLSEREVNKIILSDCLLKSPKPKFFLGPPSQRHFSLYAYIHWEINHLLFTYYTCNPKVPGLVSALPAHSTAESGALFFISLCLQI